MSGTDLRRLLEAVGGPALVAVVVVIAVVALLGRGADVRLVPVLSASMAPHVPMGAIAVTTAVAPDDVAEGDVIAFAPPPPFSTVGDRPVLHRVVAVDVLPDGTRTVRTQGDANPAPDPWTVDLGGGGHLARSHLAIPLLGFLTAGGTLGTAALLGGLILLRLLPSLLRRPTDACTCPA